MISDYELALKLQQQLEEDREGDQNTNILIALNIQEQYNEEYSIDNAGNKLYYADKKNDNKDSKKSLIDPSWEIIDPTPDIHVLFMTYNNHFFWNKLLSVCVDWSKRMTTCAGVCSYRSGGLCKITLSEPLLKLRPRKDLVETLLHEMIHAYLFVTNNNRDRDGHGPEFHKHMYRINSEAGTRITVYHDFHDEVRLYQQHWWKCNGPCQHMKPFFGMIRRAINRAPGPKDFWWAQHKSNCGGEFIKVKEPQKATKTKKPSATVTKQVTSPKADIRSYFKKDNDKENMVLNQVTPPKKVPKPNFDAGATGTSTIDYSIVRNHWLKKFDIPACNNKIKAEESSKRINVQTLPEVVCPICAKKCFESDINKHLDGCITSGGGVDDCAKCDICNKVLKKRDLVTHMQNCLNISSDMDQSFILIDDDD